MWNEREMPAGRTGPPPGRTRLLFGTLSFGLCPFLLLLLFSPRVAFAADAWWNPGWKCRYELTLAPGAGDVAWTRFNIPPGCHSQGEDARIIDERGQEIRREVLFFEPAVYGVVAFDSSGPSQRYWLYLGNPEPKTRSATRSSVRFVARSPRRPS